MDESWTRLEAVIRKLGGLSEKDIKGTELEAAALSTLFKNGDLTPEEMAEGLADAIEEVLESKS